ncbi:MAG: hypothetical protein AAGA85_27510 [Bacteroidota bacterium]
MKDPFEQLKSTWQEAKKEQTAADSSAMLQTILRHHGNSKRAHLMTILILSITALGLMAFFYYLAPLQTTLSRIGIGLMTGGLIVRIVIELVSHQKSIRIDYASNSNRSAKQAQAFYHYRKKIHGPVTLIIVALYTIGFYLLTPEFSNYFSTFWMWMIDGSYLVIGTVLFLGIRQGVVKEMQDLQRIYDLQDALNEA